MLDIVEIAIEKGLEVGLDRGKSLGIVEGKSLGGMEAAREMLLELLLEKFGVVPDEMQDEIGQIDSQFNLKTLFRQAIKCSDMEAFEGMVRRVRGMTEHGDKSGKVS